MKASGRNTAESTRVMPTMAPDTCFIALTVASAGEIPSSAMIRSTFSTTTMASSTTSPMASTIASRVSRLTLKPKASISAAAPSIDRGMVATGISTLRSEPRQR